MSALGDALGRKAGPFTVGAWVAIAAAGIGIGLVARRSFGGAKAAPVAAPAADPFERPPVQLVPAITNVPLVTSMTRSPTTNQEWGRQALERLVAEGQDPAQAQAALARFITGDPVTAQQAALITLAIRALGSPPEFVKALEVIPPPTATPTPAPPPNRGPWMPGQTLKRGDFGPAVNSYKMKLRYVSGKPSAASGGPDIFDGPTERATVDFQRFFGGLDRATGRAGIETQSMLEFAYDGERRKRGAA